MQSPLQIGTNRQLFLDRLLLDSAKGVDLCINAPGTTSEPVMVADRPWEGKLGCFNTVMREKDTFRMWYEISTEVDGRSRHLLCYAHSTDGIHWQKPCLNQVQYNGNTKNNIVAPLSPDASQAGATVFRDDRAPAEKRYKLWTKYYASDDDRAAGVTTGLWAMVSPDGFCWNLLRDGYPLRRGNASDTQSTCFWDLDLGKYVGFCRIKKFPAGRQRTCSVGVFTSDDFRNWTTAREVFAADERDEASPVPGGLPAWRPPVDFYVPGGMKVPQVPRAYVILPSAYYHWDENAFPSTLDVRLATSRDLKNWWQHPKREPFLRLGADGTAGAGMIFVSPWLIPVKDELWLYYTGTGADHRGKQGNPKKSAVFRARIRRDGFISADAGYGGGEFTTPLMLVSGKHLELNLDGSAGGWLQVEALDEKGKPVPGYALEDCLPLRGNSVRKAVTWVGQKDTTALANQPVRLRFVMRQMKLFALQFF